MLSPVVMLRLDALFAIIIGFDAESSNRLKNIGTPNFAIDPCLLEENNILKTTKKGPLAQFGPYRRERFRALFGMPPYPITCFERTQHINRKIRWEHPAI